LGTDGARLQINLMLALNADISYILID